MKTCDEALKNSLIQKVRKVQFFLLRKIFQLFSQNLYQYAKILP